MGLFSKTGVTVALIYAASIGAVPSHYAGVKVAPDIKVDFQFYRVSGADVGTVMRQITALSPTQADGHIGKASYQLSWQLQTKATDYTFSAQFLTKLCLVNRSPPSELFNN